MNTTSNLPPAVQQSFNYKLLSTPVPNMIHRIPADKYLMPRNGGSTLRQRRYNPLATALVPLGNTGITPPGQNLTNVDIDATISYYGTYVQINEQVTLTVQDPVLNQASIRLGVSMRQTEDTLVRDMLASTASFINCTGGVNGDSPTNLTLTDVDEVVATLMNNNAYSVMDSIEAQDKFGTAPIRRSYFALAHTALTKNLSGVNGFIHVAQYPKQDYLNSEWGSIASLRFLLSSIGSITPNASMLGANVYNIFCVGMEAYGVIEQDGYSAKMMYRPPAYSDPLMQNCSIGYKFAQCPRITNDLWVLNLRATLLV